MVIKTQVSFIQRHLREGKGTLLKESWIQQADGVRK